MDPQGKVIASHYHNDVNREVTGTFNPCFGCDFAKACVQELANDYKRR